MKSIQQLPWSYTLPTLPPLCGEEWYEKHKDDYSQDEIDALGIVVSVDGKAHAEIRQGHRKGLVEALIESDPKAGVKADA